MRAMILPVAVLWAGIVQAQSVVPDGSTQTRVQIGTNGHVTVGVAPADTSRISQNNFKRFNVDKPGLTFDNTSARARTIVGEVTGRDPSRINGRVTVQGSKAHLILANPNGISLNGGHFVNTGQVAIGVGRSSRKQVGIGGGGPREDILLETSGASLTVAGGGLSGDMDALHLIAREMQIDGPVHNSNAEAGSFVSLLGGASVTRFDSSVVPGDLARPFAYSNGRGVTSDGEMLVRLGSAGGVYGARVDVRVTDAGAGVRMAGQGLATAAGFTLSADGDILIDSGATVQAATDLRATSARGALRVSEAELNATDALQLGAIRTGPVEISRTRMSGGDVDLRSGGDLSLESSSVVGDGHVRASAIQDIRDKDSRIEAGKDLTFTSARGALSFTDSTLFADGTLQARAAKGIHAADVVAQAGRSMLWEGTSLRFASQDRLSAIAVTEGTLELASRKGDITNSGVVLQGQQPVQTSGSDPVAVRIMAAGSYRSSTPAADRQGLIFGVNGAVEVTAQSGDIDIKDSRIEASGDIRLDAARDIALRLSLPEGGNRLETVVVTGTDTVPLSFGLFARKSRTTRYAYGLLPLEGATAGLEATGGDIRISGRDLSVTGGTVQAMARGRGGDIMLDLRGNIHLETVGTGTFKIRRSCFFGCSYRVRDDLQLHGGQILADGDIRMRAGQRFTSAGGQVTGLGDVDLEAPEVRLEALTLPVLVTRPGGLYNFWKSDAAWYYLEDRFGGLLAGAGQVRIASDDPVKLVGATVSGGAGTDIAAGTHIVRAPVQNSPLKGERIGQFADLPGIGRDWP